LRKAGAKENRLQAVHTRLFASDVTELKRLGQTTGIAWQIELRLLVRRTLREQQQFALLEDVGKRRGR
jgi:hypothetical protein